MIAIAATMANTPATDRVRIRKCRITGTPLCATMTLANSTKKALETKARLKEGTKLKGHENVHMETMINIIAIKNRNLNLAVVMIDTPIEGLTLTTGTIQEGKKSREEAILRGTIRKLFITGKSRLPIVLSIGSRSGREVGSEVHQARPGKCTGLIIESLKPTTKGSTSKI
jgi:hypothetical protein